MSWFKLAVALIVAGVLAAAVIKWWSSRRGDIHFTDIAAQAGLNKPPDTRAEGRYRLIETMGTGIAIIDYNGDGWYDLLIGQGGMLPGDAEPISPTCLLYRNNRDGTFTDVTDAAGLTFTGYVQGIAVGDYDADGHPDIFVGGFEQSALFRNDGDGKFEEVSQAAGLEVDGWPVSAAWADLSGNGYLDLYVVRYLRDTIDEVGFPTVRCPTNHPGTPDRFGYCPPYTHPPQADVLFRNNGDGTFSDVSQAAGLAEAPAPGMGLVIADFDDDGRLDVYVSNDMKPNQLWRNLGDMRFEEVAVPAGVAFGDDGEARAGMGIAAGDYTGNGLLDLLVTNFQDEPNDLYRHESPGVFTTATREAGLDAASSRVLGFGTGFLDADNDGHLDLFVTNGHLNDFRVLGKPYTQPPQLFRNDGRAAFEDISSESGSYFQGKWLGRAAAFGDLNNDGLTDIVVSHLDRPPAMLRNESRRQGSFLGFLLESDTPSRSAVGTQVSLAINGRTINRRVFAGSGYLASHDPRLLIGLGTEQPIGAVSIRWPSGNEQIIENLQADRYYRVQEGSEPRVQGSL